MQLKILKIIDETPKGLTTGFQLKVVCQVETGPEFTIGVPVLITKAVIEQKIALSNLLILHLEKYGLDACPDMFIDTRKLELDKARPTEVPVPCTVDLGGMEMMNKRVVEKLSKR